jgi:uncharacterized protein (TIGR01777 family)
MKIFLTGGSGFIGRRLAAALAARGEEVTVLTRSANGRVDTAGVAFVGGDPRVPGSWQHDAAAADAVINLAGASIFGRWTRRRKRAILESRTASTAHITSALAARKNGKRGVLINASAVGYYGFRGDEEIDESAPGGSDFLAGVCAAWEEAAMAAAGPGCRVVRARFGLVLGEKGGVLGKMLPLARLGLGGPLGSGKQWFPWVHVDDLVGALLFLLDREDLDGPFNICSPHPVRNRELAQALGRALHRPAFLRAPGFVIRLALGKFGTVILRGQKTVPRRLLEAGYVFRHPDLDSALVVLLKR